jgi:hypothetical protein
VSFEFWVLSSEFLKWNVDYITQIHNTVFAVRDNLELRTIWTSLYVNW